MNKQRIKELVKDCSLQERQKLLKDKEFVGFMQHFPAKREKAVDEYFRLTATGDFHYLTCTDKEDNQTAICTRCGKRVHIGETRHKHSAACPYCKIRAEVIHGWRKRTDLEDKFYFVYYSATDTGELLGRGYIVYRAVDHCTGEVSCEWNTVDYYYFNKGKCEQWRYHFPSIVCDHYYQGRFKKAANVYSAVNAMQYCKFITHDGWYSLRDCINKTVFKYSMAKEYERYAYYKGNGLFPNMVQYLAFYIKHPQIEFMIKQGFLPLLYEGLKERSFQGTINWRGDTPSKIFKMTLRKEEVKLLAASVNSLHQLRMLQLFNKQSGGDISADCIQLTTKINPYYIDDYEKVWKLCKAKVAEATSYIENQKSNNIYISMRDWTDYLSQCKALGLDLADTAISKPRNLQVAHENATMQLKLKANKELEKKIKKLAKQREELAFAEKEIFIRPAESAQELIDEGKALMHCVGTYADKHASGKCTILFIRQTNNPDAPFYTMEIDGAFNVVQVRGVRNCGMTKEVENFVNEYKENILNQLKKARRAA